MISEFGENTNSYCSFESKETALLHSENGNLQQRVNVLTHEVRGGDREEERGRMGDMGGKREVGKEEEMREKAEARCNMYKIREKSTLLYNNFL